MEKKNPCKYIFFSSCCWISLFICCCSRHKPFGLHTCLAHIPARGLHLLWWESPSKEKERDVKRRFLEIWWLEKLQFLPRIFLKTGKNNRTGTSYLWGKGAFSVDVFHSTERHRFRPINLWWGQQGLPLFRVHRQSKIFSKHFNRIDFVKGKNGMSICCLKAPFKTFFKMSFDK